MKFPIKIFSSLAKAVFFLLLFAAFHLNPKIAISAVSPGCGCGNGICQPDRGELLNCAGQGQDCAGKATCDAEVCNPVPNGCCPGNPATGAKCQGVLMGPDYDPDCRSICYQHTCPNGLIDQPGEKCEVDPVTKAEKFATGVMCKAGTCYTMGVGACHCCGDGNVDPGEMCDPSAPPSTGSCPVGSSCTESCTCATCNNGIIEPGEECDGFGTECMKGGQAGKCTDNCKCQVLCGNGLLDPGETCDDGPNNGKPGFCRTDCHICGDGTKNGPEKCDKLDPKIPPDGCMVGEKCNDSCNCETLPPPPPKCSDNIFNQPSESCEFDIPMGGKVKVKDPLTMQCSEVGANACRKLGTPDECSCCGDGIKQAGSGESCDAGKSNAPITDMSGACRVDCGSCGDKIKQASEACEVPADCGDPTKFKCNNCKCEPIIIPQPTCGDNIFNRPSETCEFDMGGNVTSNPPPAACTKTGLSACRIPGSPDECSCCGDNVPQGTETCDQGTMNKPVTDMSGACRVDCGFCKDGIKQASEECEINSDCSAGKVCNGCKCEPKAIVCGDNTIDPPSETCDGTDRGICKVGTCRDKTDPNGCSCCGDGVSQRGAGETCDDGLDNGKSGKCRDNCTICGDGLTQNGDGETCDDGSENGNPGKCRKSCTKCGDKILQIGEGETCESNTHCKADETCQGCVCVKNPPPPPTCGNGKVDADKGETCDEGPLNGTPGHCRADCTICGDTLKNGPEQCDKADPKNPPNGCVAGQVCNNSCNCEASPPPPARCGNGTYEPANNETCDTPQTGICGANRCRLSNEPAPCSCCGDSNKDVLAGEQCDDGANNGKETSNCTATCKLKPPVTAECGNTTIDGSETCDGSARANKNGVKTVCQQDCRDKNATNSCSCCGDLNIDRPSEDCDPPNGTTCDNFCKTITAGPTPTPGGPNPAPTPTPEPVYCSIEGAGGCGSNLSHVLPNPCIASVIQPSIWQTMNSFTFAQWFGSLFIPGMLFGIVRFRRQKK